MNIKKNLRILKYKIKKLIKYPKIKNQFKIFINKITQSKEYKKMNDIFGAKALIFFSIIIIFIFVLLIINPIKNVDGYTDGLIVEATGFLFDIALFGSFLMWYDHWKNKKNKIEQDKRDLENKITHYIEEIDDYREWKEKEASYRIYGLVKRLKKLGIEKFDLSYCYFEEVRFSNNMSIGFIFTKSNLIGTTFNDCILWGSRFNELEEGKIDDFADFLTFWHEPTKFINCDLIHSDFMDSNFYRLHFMEGCNLDKSEFRNSIFSNCKFENAHLEDCSFKNIKFDDECEFINIDFTSCKIENVSYTKDCKLINCQINEKMTLIER